jgi:hypothetical protein
VGERFSKAICRHLKAEEARFKDPVLDERYDAILEGLEQARALGQEPGPWLIAGAKALYADLDWRMAKRARLVSELDRWIDFQAGKALQKN